MGEESYGSWWGPGKFRADPAHLWERLHLHAPSKRASGWASDVPQGRWVAGRWVAPPGWGCESVVPQELGPHLAAGRCLVSTDSGGWKAGVSMQRPGRSPLLHPGKWHVAPHLSQGGAAAGQSVAKRTWEWLGAAQLHQPSKGLEATGR